MSCSESLELATSFSLSLGSDSRKAKRLAWSLDAGSCDKDVMSQTLASFLFTVLSCSLSLQPRFRGTSMANSDLFLLLT